MKQKSTKILLAMIIIILVAGTIMLFTKGLSFDLKLQDSQKVEITIGKTFEKEDIKNITKEVFGTQPVLIRGIELYGEAVSITTTQISDEQKTELVNKINEKYGTTISTDDVTIEQIAHVRGRDFIKPYIVPFIIVTVIILACLMIRYYKLNGAKVLFQSISIIVLAQLVLLGIILITRMPIGRYTIPVILIVYILSTYICTTKFDYNLENLSKKIKVTEKK